MLRSHIPGNEHDFNQVKWLILYLLISTGMTDIPILDRESHVDKDDFSPKVVMVIRYSRAKEQATHQSPLFVPTQLN